MDIWLHHLSHRYISVKKSVGNQPSRPSMQGQGMRRAHIAAVPWLYHATQAQPCLPYVEICIGLILVADLAWVRVCVCGATSNLSLLPQIIQLPCAITEHGGNIFHNPCPWPESFYPRLIQRAEQSTQVESVRSQLFGIITIVIGFVWRAHRGHELQEVCSRIQAFVLWIAIFVHDGGDAARNERCACQSRKC